MTPGKISQISRHRSLVFSFVLLTFCLKLTTTENYSSTTSATAPAPATTSLPSPPTTHTTVITPTTIKDNKISEKINQQDVKPVIQVQSSEVLDLSSKNITSLPGLIPDYRTTIKVQLLNLSANHLNHLPANAFTNLTQLKCLDLAENNIATINPNAFTNLGNLQHLNLTQNHLTTLSDETFKGLVSLQQLDLSFNNLTNIAPGALELSSLTRLVLAGNPQLGSNGEPFIATGKRLQTLDATKISLKQIPSALTHSIRTLHLLENQIPSIRRGDMDSYPLLQLLDLTSNILTDIEEDALGRLEMLTILYLTHNQLKEVPHSLPERLKVLHLEFNRLTKVDPLDLNGLSSLEVLLLTGNHITKISNGAFVQVPGLVTLDLSQNPIEELPAGCLTGPSKLRVLRLAQLNISLVTIKETAFPLFQTEFLITLDLSGSPAVARQWLGDTAALAAARELQELDLSGCAIETLPRDTMHYLPQLRALHLRDNALNCSGLAWLAEWMRVQEVVEYREVYCQSPGELWGTLLVDLQSLQEVNIDEKQTKIDPGSKTRITETIPIPGNKGVESDKNQPKKSIMNISKILNENITTSHLTTLNFSTPNFTTPKKFNRVAPMENDILDVTSIIWPKAIKTVTLPPTPASSQRPQTIPNISSTSSTLNRNLFMKNSTASQPKTKPKIQPPTTILQELENVTTHGEHGEAYSYTSSEDQHNQPHPGMYLLIVGIMGATLILITLTTRMSRRTRDDLQILRAYPHDELIEVSSLPSVTDLW